MQIFTEYVAWQNYAATEFATAEVVEERAQALVKRLEAQALVLSNPKPGEVLKAKAGFAASPEIDRASQDLLNAYAARKMTQVIRDNCERCAALVSRELTRRTANTPLDRRQMRWAP